jgi:hypothetical protein
VVTNAVTVRRSHNGIRLWSETLAGNQLTYLAFFFALFAAFDLREIYKDLCFIAILLSLVFFAIGLLNNRTHEQLVLSANHPKCDENCAQALDAGIRKRILGVNPALAIASFVMTVALVLALQYGKKKVETKVSPSIRPPEQSQ